MDHVKVSSGEEYDYLINARDTFTGWVEAQAVPTKSTEAVVTFLKDLLSRHGGVRRIVVDNGRSLVSQEVRTLLAERNIQLVPTTKYNPRGNSVVERGHRDLLAGLAKVSQEAGQVWWKVLPEVLWADRITINTTGYSPYYLVYGREAITPVDILFHSWEGNVPPSLTTAELIAFRSKQIREQADHVFTARQELCRQRRIRRDQHQGGIPASRERPMEGDLVLLWRSSMDRTFHAGRKLQPKWTGPYRCIGTVGNSFRLADLHGLEYAEWVSGHRVKKYFQRSDLLPRTRQDDIGSASPAEALELNVIEYHESPRRSAHLNPWLSQPQDRPAESVMRPRAADDQKGHRLQSQSESSQALTESDVRAWQTLPASSCQLLPPPAAIHTGGGWGFLVRHVPRGLPPPDHLCMFMDEEYPAWRPFRPEATPRLPPNCQCGASCVTDGQLTPTGWGSWLGKLGRMLWWALLWFLGCRIVRKMLWVAFLGLVVVLSFTGFWLWIRSFFPSSLPQPSYGTSAPGTFDPDFASIPHDSFLPQTHTHTHIAISPPCLAPCPLTSPSTSCTIRRTGNE